MSVIRERYLREKSWADSRPTWWWLPRCTCFPVRKQPPRGHGTSSRSELWSYAAVRTLCRWSAVTGWYRGGSAAAGSAPERTRWRPRWPLLAGPGSRPWWSVGSRWSGWSTSPPDWPCTATRAARSGAADPWTAIGYWTDRLPATSAGGARRVARSDLGHRLPVGQPIH